MTKSQLRRTFNQLKTLTNPQERGYKFEQLIFEILDSENLSPSPPYRQPGEQIDGLFKFEHRYYLLETKWTVPVSVSDIYIFRAKIEGKLTGTLGVFISANNYTKDVYHVLPHGKEINIVLFDGDDIALALADNCSFSTVLEIKLRRAAQYGEVYYPYKNYLFLNK